MKTQILLLIPILAASLSLGSCSSSKHNAIGQKHEFTILFTNDTHSQILPLEYSNMGGAINRKVVIDSIRNANANVVLVDAGDVVQGTPYFNMFKGEVEMMIMNELGYDLRTLGNHEFDNQIEGLKQMLLWNDRTTALSTNYNFEDSTIAALVKKSAIISLGNIKIGFIGTNINPTNIIDPTYCKGVSYTDPIDIADKEALKLKQQGADIVIALSHLGLTDEDKTGNTADIDLIQRSKNIDMLIGGHTHTYLHSPYLACNLNGDSIPILQAGKYGAYLGCVTIHTNAKNKITKIDYTLIPITPRHTDRTDKALANKINTYTAAMEQQMNKTLCIASSHISNNTAGNWICDALSLYSQKYMNTKVDFAIYNIRGIRRSIDQGEVTMKDIFQVFPFDNNLSIITLNGNDVIKMFETIARRGGEAVSQEVKLTIQNHKIKQLLINGTEVVDTQVYTIAMPDYVANGGDQITSGLNILHRKDYPMTIRDMVIEHLTELHANNIPLNASTAPRTITYKN